MILAPKTRAGINNTNIFNIAALIILSAIGPCNEHPPPLEPSPVDAGVGVGLVGVGVGVAEGPGVGEAVGPGVALGVGVGVGPAARTD